MCRRAPRCLSSLLLAGLIAAPMTGAGQQTEQELVQRLDSLLPLLEEARVEAAAAREERRKGLDAMQPTEALGVGLLHVLVLPGASGPALDVVGSVWTQDYAPFIDRSPSLERDRIFFQWAVDPEEYSVSSFQVRVVSARRWRPRSFMESEVRRVVSESLKGDLVGTEFQNQWGIGSVRPPVQPQDLYRRFAVSPSKATRSCLEGDAGACLTALGLRLDDYPLDDWYSPEERRLLVQRQASRFSRYPAEMKACADGDLGKCDEALELYSSRWSSTQWAAPVVPETRSSFLWFALQQGGDGAWGRLLDHLEDGPLTALEAASGQDGLALARGWQAWLMAQRPASHAGMGSLTLAALAWAAILLTLAARSTRWRLG